MLAGKVHGDPVLRYLVGIHQRFEYHLGALFGEFLIKLCQAN